MAMMTFVLLMLLSLGDVALGFETSDFGVRVSRIALHRQSKALHATNYPGIDMVESDWSPRVLSMTDNMGMQNLLQRALLEHEISVGITTALMVGLGVFLGIQAKYDRGLGEYWFTLLIIFDLAYSIGG